ncbi:MAG: hypothetical protein J6S65_07580, partial [Bacteroidaceae bacterium]|nr:hypothetical protein [Bacteroidaceae bacterium]
NLTDEIRFFSEKIKEHEGMWAKIYKFAPQHLNITENVENDTRITDDENTHIFDNDTFRSRTLS